MKITLNVLFINYYFYIHDVRTIIDNNKFLSKMKQYCLLLKQIKVRTYYHTWHITL
jgi:hypothetical protein